jgi:hypothetical protein
MNFEKACKHGVVPRVVKLFDTTESFQKESGLNLVLKNGRTEIIKIFIEKYFDLKMCHGLGDPVCTVAESGSIEAFELVAKSLSETDKSRFLSRKNAPYVIFGTVRGASPKRIELLRHLLFNDSAVLNFLLNVGFDVYISNDHKLLVLAVMEHSLDCVKILLEKIEFSKDHVNKAKQMAEDDPEMFALFP